MQTRSPRSKSFPAILFEWERYRTVVVTLLIVFGVLLLFGDLGPLKALIGTLVVAAAWATVVAIAAAGRRWPRLWIFLWAAMFGGLVAAGFLSFWYLKAPPSGGWTVYDAGNAGLPIEWVHPIAFDPQGRAWVGTTRGVRVFDGQNWVAYDTSNSGLLKNDVRAIAFDPQGRAWVGTRGEGIAVFDGERWTTFHTTNSGLPDNDVQAITFDAEGRAWVGGGSGVGVFDGQKWTAHVLTELYLIPADAGAIAFDGQGRAWVGTKQGVKVFDGQVWTTYNTRSSGLVDNYVQAIAFDPQGRAWVGTKAGISVFDGQSWTTYNTRNSGLPFDWVEAITFDPQGRAWIATQGIAPPPFFKGTFEGAVAVTDGQNWTTYSTANSGLPPGFVTSIVFDRQGRAWVGTRSGIGVFQESTR